MPRTAGASGCCGSLMACRGCRGPAPPHERPRQVEGLLLRTPRPLNEPATARMIPRMLRIDVHTHILPPPGDWPDLAAKFGYAGWIALEEMQKRGATGCGC